MKQLVFYLPSGEIDMVATVPDDADPQTLSELPYIEVEEAVDSRKQWVNAGALTSYSEAGAMTKASFPGVGWTWSPQSEKWIDGRSQDLVWSEVRAERNRRLAASDWTDTYSAPARLGQALYDQWQAYRQALRDITNQADPFNIEWPEIPSQ